MDEDGEMGDENGQAGYDDNVMEEEEQYEDHRP